jgi:Leucine-rich repeat (LRR) protein
MKNILIIILIIVSIGSTGYIIGSNRTDKFENSVSEIESKTVTYGVINLSGQGLTKAPENIFSKTSTVELNLSNNLLTGALQSQIGQLKRLKVLDLSNNKFTGVPAEVGQLTNLEILNLSNNSLTGLPNELGNLSKLKFLDVSGNNYSESDLAGIKKKLPAFTFIKIK